MSSVKKTLGKEASLPSVKKNTRQRASLLSVFFLPCRVFFFRTRQISFLPSARKKTLGNPLGTRQRAGLRLCTFFILTIPISCLLCFICRSIATATKEPSRSCAGWVMQCHEDLVCWLGYDVCELVVPMLYEH